VIPLNKLIQNEMMKLIAKKRLVIIAIIIGILVAMFTYAQYKEVERQREKLGTDDWRTMIQQTIIDQQNRISSSRISEINIIWITTLILLSLVLLRL
jgi:ABC-2 type transport system permease protein